MYKIELNTARNCLRYVVRAFNIKEIFVPFYTCPVVWQSLQKENCKIHFYHTDKNFMPVDSFPEDAFILYTNYFGICAKNVKEMCRQYKNIIIDNAQAFFMPSFGIASFFSARKFLQVNDGAILYTQKAQDTKFQYDSSYLVKDKKEYGFNVFNDNEIRLNNKEIMYMAKNTKSEIENTDLDKIRKSRLSNFNFLNEALKNTNELKTELDSDDVPMYYPYLNFDTEKEKKLKKAGIYVEHLWNKLPDNITESIFQRYLMLLPVDQKQTTASLDRISNLILH